MLQIMKKTIIYES